MHHGSLQVGDLVSAAAVGGTSACTVQVRRKMGKVVYRMTPSDFAEKARELVKAGANIIGGCCGTSPDFIRALAAKLS